MWGLVTFAYKYHLTLCLVSSLTKDENESRRHHSQLIFVKGRDTGQVEDAERREKVMMMRDEDRYCPLCPGYNYYYIHMLLNTNTNMLTDLITFKQCRPNYHRDICSLVIPLEP